MDHVLPRSDFPQTRQDEDGVTRLLEEFGRAKSKLVISVLIGLLVGYFFWLYLPERYTASVLVLVQSRVMTVPELSLTQEPEATAATVRSEVALILSHAVLERAVERLRSAEIPLIPSAVAEEADATGQPRAGAIARICEGLPAYVLTLVRSCSDLAPKLASVRGNDDQEETARGEWLDEVRENLDVHYNNLDHVIQIDFTHQVPEVAAHVANSVAQAYIEIRSSHQRDVSASLVRVLSERAEALGRQVRKADDQVELFQAENRLVETDKGSLMNQQLTELTAELSLARARLEDRRATYQDARYDADVDAVAEVVESATILKLRELEAELDQEEARLAKELGPQHPRLQGVRRELNSVRTSITAEIRRIRTKIARSVGRSQEQVNALEQRISDFQSTAVRDAADYSRLHRLEREAASARRVYEAFLVRLEQAKSMEGRPPSEAVVSSASPPRHVSNLPAPVLSAAGGIAGFLLCAIWVLIQHYRDRGFESLSELSRATGMRALSSLPLDRKRLGDIQRVVALVSNNPDSPVVESIRASGLQLVRAEGGGSGVSKRSTVVEVTSALEHEGKSTFAVALAATAARDGYRTLLVECDLRRPCLAQAFGAVTGRVDNGGDAPWSGIFSDHAPGLHILPACGRCPYPHKYLREDFFGSLLQNLDRHYDIIVLDTPPVMHVTDAISLARQADATILVVAYRRTKRAVVHEAIRRIREAQGHVDGVVLTKAKRMNGTEYYYGYQKRACNRPMQVIACGQRGRAAARSCDDRKAWA